MSLFDFKCEVIELPTFTPNSYLWEHHQNKGKEKWEIYAWAIREVMTTAGDLEKIDTPFRDKLEYEANLGFRKAIKNRKQQEEKEPLLDDEAKDRDYGVNS
jgi:hypothetical protein